MKLFFGTINEKIAELNAEESFHFSKVLRGNIDDIIYLTDGCGTLIKGNVIEISTKKVIVKIIEQKIDDQKKNYYLHVAISPTKNIDRIEFFLEKATEIGIDEVTFLNTFHSERKVLKVDRLEKIVSAATKQSLKTYLAKVNGLIKLKEFIDQDFSSYDAKYIAHCNNNFTRQPFSNLLANRPKKILILIGPEGDFSTEEINTATNFNFTGISFGNQRFRTETAALQAVFATDWCLKS